MKVPLSPTSVAGTDFTVDCRGQVEGPADVPLGAVHHALPLRLDDHGVLSALY